MLATLPPPPVLWTHPDRDPFRGSAGDAARLFVRAGLPEAIVRAQFRALAAGRCHARDLRQGERLTLMLFGRSRVLRNVVAEPALWQLRVPRAAVECAVEHDGRRFSLVVPAVCHNYSEEVHALPGAAPFPVWGAPFAPPAGPMPGFGETIGGNEESVGEIGGAGFGVFAGGIGGELGVPPNLTTEREISFIALHRRRFHRVEYEAYRHLVHRALYVTPPEFPMGESVPPISGVTPPGETPTPPQGSSTGTHSVPEPAGWAILATALALLAGLRMLGRRR